MEVKLYGLLYKPQQLIFTNYMTVEFAKIIGWTYEELIEEEDKEV